MVLSSMHFIKQEASIVTTISVYNRKRIINMHFVQGYGYKKIRKFLNHQIDVKTIRRYCNDYAEALEKGGKEAARPLLV